MFAASFLMACGKPPANEIKLSPIDTAIKGQVVDLPADRRAAWVVSNSNPEDKTKAAYFVCAEPPTDAGLTIVQSGKASGEHMGSKAAAELSREIGLQEFSGRTPAVLALRDVMYRMCEARLQGANFQKETEESKLFNKIVDAIDKFAAAEKLSADAAKERAIASNPVEDSRRQAAKANELEAIKAIGEKKWADAKKYFAACEAESPGFRACFDMLRELEKRTDDKEIATALLKYEGYFPRSIRDQLRQLAGSQKK
jgi:hypothetical protein